MLQFLKTECEKIGRILDIEHFTVDFELGMMLAIEVEFPSVPVRGCRIPPP